MDWISKKYYKVLKDLTDENGSGFYSLNEEKTETLKRIENLLLYLENNFGKRKSYELHYSNHKFTVDITEYGLVTARIY